MNLQLQIFINYILVIFLILLPFILFGMYILKADENKYKKNLDEIKNNYKEQPDKYLPEIISVSKKRLLNLEFNKFENDLFPLIKDILQNNESCERIENILRQVRPNDTYKPGSSMSSPSDAIDINEKAWKITEILDEVLKK
jgi:hypothetical protein